MSGPLRRSGLLIPLFSAPSSSSWGIGEIGDVGPLCAWLAASGQRVLQLLPLNEMAPGNQSPYSALSTMAIDPIYISLREVDEFRWCGGEASLDESDRERLREVRAAASVQYRTIRDIKHRALCAAFDRFTEREPADPARAEAFRRYVEAEAWWLDDYALFRAIHDREAGRSWSEWPAGLRQRDPRAMEEARGELSRDIRFYQYLQWLAGTQWAGARAAARDHGVALFGDLPFMVDAHSADVWANQSQFDLDRSVGVPPDAFSATGQDWGMPPYDWPATMDSDFAWLRRRARRSAGLYDGYRVDHLVGFYRTYSRPRSGDGEPSFAPDHEEAQRALGERVLQLLRDAGAEIIAEDLGTVPDFVRASLAALGIPGFRVFRWEREWDAPGQPFRDPAGYPAISVATTGTHDTEPLVTWWNGASDEERAAVAALPSLARTAHGADLRRDPYEPAVRDAILEAIFASASNLVLFPVQDVFGWADRINEPATVHAGNWTYRLPWFVDALDDDPVARAGRQTLRRWADEYGRGE